MAKTLGDSLTSAKANIKVGVETTSRIVKNAEQLVQAVALLIIAAFAYTKLHTVTNKWGQYVLVASLVVVGLRALVEFIKFLDKRD